MPDTMGLKVLTDCCRLCSSLQGISSGRAVVENLFERVDSGMRYGEPWECLLVGMIWSCCCGGATGALLRRTKGSSKEPLDGYLLKDNT